MDAPAKGETMSCYLLHMIEMPEQNPYKDPNLKDLVGEFPRLFCAQCAPPLALSPSDSARCLDRDAPCWKVPGPPCAEDT